MAQIGFGELGHFFAALGTLREYKDFKYMEGFPVLKSQKL